VGGVIVQNATQGQVLGSRVRRADTFRLRLLGLMFVPCLGEGEGLLIRPCKAVHTHFMRFAIDVIFLDGENRVVHLALSLKPWKQSPYVRQAVAVLELPAGAAQAVHLGDQLAIG
jgi:uncharacterized protein